MILVVVIVVILIFEQLDRFVSLSALVSFRSSSLRLLRFVRTPLSISFPHVTVIGRY